MLLITQVCPESLFKQFMALNAYSRLNPWTLPVKTALVIEKDKITSKPESCLREKSEAFFKLKKKGKLTSDFGIASATICNA